MNILHALALIFTISSSNCFAQGGGGQEVGNGGDPLHLIFRKARVDAISVLKTFASRTQSDDDVDGLFSMDVYRFLLSSAGGLPLYLRMADDIAASEHMFFDPDLTGITQSTCARTNIPTLPSTTIRFSLPHCRASITDSGEDHALKVLIHESTHHFGVGGSVSDEAFAWDVAEQLFAFWQGEQLRNGPHWQSLPMAGAPSARYESAAAATDEGLFVWGGCNYSQLPHRESCERFLETGAVLSVTQADARWEDVAVDGAPSGRKFAKAVYTGKHPGSGLNRKVVVFGGCSGPNSACEELHADGGIWDLAEKIWRPLPSFDPALGRIHHTVIWAGDQMIVYGGLGPSQRTLRDLWILSLDAHQDWRWTKVDVPLSFQGRYGHTATWTGSKMVVFGGCAESGLIRCREKLNDGFIYDPVSKVFSPLPEAPINGRLFHSAAWTGHDLIIWGGQRDFNAAHNDGALLHLDRPDLSWTGISAILPVGEILGRYHHQAHWTGSSMLVYGGEISNGQFASSTLKFEYLMDRPAQQSWRLVDTKSAPIARKGHAQAWFAGYLIVWGGYGDDQTFLPTGAMLKNGP